MDLGYEATEMRMNSWYIMIYTVLSKFFVVHAIPWVTVLILNVLIWRKLKKRNEMRRSSLKRDSGKFLIPDRNIILRGSIESVVSF